MKFLTRSIVVIAAAFAFAAHAQNLSIATGGTGGVYYPLGGGMAAVLSKYVNGMQATAEVTGGSVANLQLISTGKPYIALSMTDAALDALKGEDKFKGKPVPVRTLMILYPNRMHVVTIEGTGINGISRSQGQARVDRVGRQRNRGDGVPRHRGGRPGQGPRHAPRAPRRCRVRGGARRTARSTPSSGSAACRPRR